VILNVYVDDRTLAILEHYARENGRKIEDLAEAALAALRDLTASARAALEGVAP